DLARKAFRVRLPERPDGTGRGLRRAGDFGDGGGRGTRERERGGGASDFARRGRVRAVVLEASGGGRRRSDEDEADARRDAARILRRGARHDGRADGTVDAARRALRRIPRTRALVAFGRGCLRARVRAESGRRGRVRLVALRAR